MCLAACWLLADVGGGAFVGRAADGVAAPPLAWYSYGRPEPPSLFGVATENGLYCDVRGGTQISLKLATPVVLNRPGFDAAVFFEKDSEYAQEFSS